MCYSNLRQFISTLEEQDKLKHISKPVDKDWEIACIARWVMESFDDDHLFAIQFDNVKGYQTPVVVGLYCSKDFYASALNIDSHELLSHWSRALANPIKRSIVTGAPAKEIVARGKDINLNSLPIPVWTPGRDGGPYIPSASVITKDPETGIHNIGVYRIQIHDARTTGLFFGSQFQHGAIHYSKHCDLNKPMPVAVVIGGSPSLNFAAAAKTAYGIDELEIAGALAGFSVEVVSGETVDLFVPAEAEIVIEGFVSPNKRLPEGPFGEALGYMNYEAPAPVVEVSAICLRKDAIFHGYVQQLAPSEGHVIWEMGLLGPLWYYLKDKMNLEALCDLAVIRGSAGLGIVAAQVRFGHTEEAEKIGKALSKINFGQKVIVLVDDDIDIHDLETIQWALSSRVDPENDIQTITDVQTYQLDPAILSGIKRGRQTDDPPYSTSMLIIDATLKCDTPEISLPGKSYMFKTFDQWGKYGLPELQKRKRLERLLDTHTNDELHFGLP